MRSLNLRLSALEAKCQGDDLSHLTDEELIARLYSVCEQIEQLGGPLPDDWRGTIERHEFGQLSKLEMLPCGV